MEEYRVVRIGAWSGDVEAAMTSQLNEAAGGDWSVVAVSGAGDVSSFLWVVLRRAA